MYAMRKCRNWSSTRLSIQVCGKFSISALVRQKVVVYMYVGLRFLSGALGYEVRLSKIILQVASQEVGRVDEMFSC